MANIPDIIESFLNTLDFTLTISSFSDDGTNTTITVSDPLYAREKMLLTVDSVPLEIISVSGNDIIVPGVLSPAEAILEAPHFFHGTPYATSTHLSKIKDFKDKTPMIYLLEIIREQYDNDPQSLIERTADLRLFFLDNYNPIDWETDDHYNFVINRMRSLQEFFIQEANIYNLFGEFDNFTVIAHAKWGEWRDLSGHVNSIFDEQLSGIELQLDLPILDSPCADL